MAESSIPAGQRGTFIPDSGAPVRAVVLVAHPDGRLVLEILPNHSVVTWAAGTVQAALQQAKAAPRPPLPPELVQE